MSESPAATPRVSIIIPAYKSAPYIAATLDSVLAQTLADWECIVVDDGSPDAVAEIAEGYADRDPRIRLLRQKNAGVAAARNAGYAASSRDAEFVIFQDSDDVWTPDALALLAAALDARPDAAGAHGLADRIGPDGGLLEEPHAEIMRERFGYNKGLTRLRPDQPTTLDSLVTKFKMYPPGIVLVRRPLIARAGLWTEERSLAPSADWDMFTRIARFGPIVFVDRVIGGYRRHDSNMTAHDSGHRQRRQAILRRLVGGGPGSTPAQSLLVRRAARAWGGAVCVRQRQALQTSLRARRWRMAASDTAWLVFLHLATVASDLDLRLHRLRGRFKRA